MVLPCSAAKRSGGEPLDLHQAHGIAEWLPRKLRDELVEVRARVALRAKVDETHVRPALERYAGHLYGAAGSHLGEVVARARGVVILSGGYGAVLADEPIGTYDTVLRPADWPDGLLGRVLVATAQALAVDAVVAFLSRSTAYARIVRSAPWPPDGPWVGLVSPENDSAGGAMVTVPRSLGDALAGYVTGELRSGWTSSDGLGLRLEVVSNGHEPPSRPERRQPTIGSRDPRVEAAIARFRDRTQFVPARVFPDGLGELDTPGLYAWRVDDEGARTLKSVLGCSCRGLVYVGQAGATRWPSGNTTQATLRSRIRRQHLRGNIRSSTFRRTLAALLVDELDLYADNEARLHGEGEKRLSSWIAEHLAVAVQPIEDGDVLGAIEAHVVAALDPPLNLDHVPRTAWRNRLRGLRSDRRGLDRRSRSRSRGR